MKGKWSFMSKYLAFALVAVSVIFWITHSYGYQWVETYGGTDVGENGESVQQTTDGGYIIARGNGDVYLIKTNASGNELWSKTFGGTDRDVGNSVQQTTDGGYIIAGVTESFGAGWEDVYLIKTDASGNELWSKTFGGSEGDIGKSVQQTTDGGYIIAGRNGSFSGSGQKVYLIKTDASGNELWSKTFGEAHDQKGRSVRQTTDGGYIIAGDITFWGPGPEYLGDVYLIKTDASGNELWSKVFGRIGYLDGSSSVQQTTDGGYIIAGFTESFMARGSVVYLVYYRPDGDEPRPDIKANGSDGPITVSSSDSITLTVRLDPGYQTHQYADWCIYADTPDGLYSRVPLSGWKPGFHLSGPQKVIDLPNIEIGRGLPLWLGDYTFYFAMDDNADGIFDGTWSDEVEIHVQP